MSADPRSLAGIEGLLQECSPCLTVPHGHEVMVWRLPDPLSHVRRREHAKDQHYEVRGDMGGIRRGSEIELDLTHRTGRVHAAWFVDAWLAGQGAGFDLTDEDKGVLAFAREGWHPFPDVMADRLRDLVLLAAGRGDAVASGPASER